MTHRGQESLRDPGRAPHLLRQAGILIEEARREGADLHPCARHFLRQAELLLASGRIEMGWGRMRGSRQHSPALHPRGRERPSLCADPPTGRLRLPIRERRDNGDETETGSSALRMLPPSGGGGGGLRPANREVRVSRLPHSSPKGTPPAGRGGRWSAHAHATLRGGTLTAEPLRTGSGTARDRAGRPIRTWGIAWESRRRKAGASGGPVGSLAARHGMLFRLRAPICSPRAVPDRPQQHHPDRSAGIGPSRTCRLSADLGAGPSSAPRHLPRFEPCPSGGRDWRSPASGAQCWWRQAGPERAHLEVTKNSLPALALYRSQGYLWSAGCLVITGRGETGSAWNDRSSEGLRR